MCETKLIFSLFSRGLIYPIIVFSPFYSIMNFICFYVIQYWLHLMFTTKFMDNVRLILWKNFKSKYKPTKKIQNYL